MLLSVKRFGTLAQKLLDSDRVSRRAADVRRLPPHPRVLRVLHLALRDPGRVVRVVVGPRDALSYPARYLFEFLKHHGFLSIKGSPQWFTVAGGSGTYIDKVTAAVGDVRVVDRDHGDHPQARQHRADRRRRQPAPGRRRRDRHARRRRAGAAHRPDRRRAPRARRLRVLAQRDAAAPRRLPAAKRGGGAVVVELSNGRLRATQRPDGGDLLDEQASGHRERRAVPGHAQRVRAHRLRPRSSRGWTTRTRSTPPRPSPPRASSRACSPIARCSPAPITAGDSTRTAAARAWTQPQALGTTW